MTPDQLKSLRATFDAATFDVAPKNAVDCPFMSSDVDDSYPWYYVRSSDGAKAAAFACEEDAECYAAARQAVPALIEEVEALRMAFSDLADDICGLQPVVTPDDAIKAISQRDFQLRQENEALLDQLSTLEKHVAHNDDEYRTMKEVLRAEHQECERLRLDNERLSTRLSAMTAARDEACDIAAFSCGLLLACDAPVDLVTAEERITALRKVGQ